ncbi:MAG: Wadjet anti-phage system protein JetD domain-containing protein [Chloroflexota bacterium]
MGVQERFVAAVLRRACGKRRVRLEELRAALFEADPSAPYMPNVRERLLDLVEGAEALGAFYQSKGSLDKSAYPFLPSFVTLPVPERREREPVVWPPAMDWASDLDLSEGEERLVRAAWAFMRRAAADEPVVPIRERSLELLGNEKALEACLGGRLFAGENRLSLEKLRCRKVSPPFVYKEVGPSGVLLVIENHHTYDTFARVLTADDRIGFVAYGQGGQFQASVSFALELPRPVTDILYYGDVDLKGLAIAVGAAEAAAGLGLPPLRPAEGPYRELLRLSIRGETQPADLPERLAAWLPEDLRAPVVELLAAGHRLAQEGLGYSRLRDDDLRARLLRAAH